MHRVAGGRAEDRNQSIGDGALPIDVAEHRHNSGNLCVNWRIENTVTSADYRFVVVEWIPGKGNAGAKILLGSIQRTVLRIELVTQAVVHCEVGPHLPGVL